MTSLSRVARLTISLLAVTLTLAACGTSQNAAIGKAAKSSSPTAPITTMSTAPQVVASTRCQPSDLRLAAEPVSEKTEQHSAMLTVTNIGTVACHLFGYPGIALYDAQGKLLPLSYKRQGDQMVTSASPRQVNLAVGATGYVLINKNVCIATAVAAAATLSFIPPDDTTSLTLDNPPGGLTSCEPGDVGMTLDISPVEPTANATGAVTTFP